MRSASLIPSSRLSDSVLIHREMADTHTDPSAKQGQGACPHLLWELKYFQIKITRDKTKQGGECTDETQEVNAVIVR